MLYQFYICLLIILNLLSIPVSSHMQPSQLLEPQNVSSVEQIAIFGTGGFIDLDYSSDGTVLAVANKRGTWLYDATDLSKEPQHLEGNIDLTLDVAFSPDGLIIAAASYDHTIWLWDAQTRQQITHFIGHQEPVTSIAFSPDSTLLVSGALDNSVRVWDIERHRTVMALNTHTTGIRNIAFSPDGERIASASNRQLIVWNIRTHEVVSWDVVSLIEDLTVLDDAKTIITAHRNGEIIFWDAESGEHITRWDDYTFGGQLALSPDGRFLAYSTSGNLMRIRDLQNPANAITIQASYYTVAFSPDGFSLAFAGERIDIWNFQTQIQVDQSPPSATWIYRVDLNPEENQVYGVTISGDVEMWDIETQQVVKRFQFPFDVPLHMDFSGRQGLLATSREGSLAVWDVSEGIHIAQIEDVFDRYTSFVVAPIGNLLAWAIEDTVTVWNIEDSRQVGKATLSASSKILSFSPDSTILAIGLRTYEIILWDFVKNQQITQFAVYPESISNLLFSTDGTKLLTVSSGTWGINIVQLWDVRSGTLLSETNVQDDRLKEVCSAFSPGGSLLVLCSGITNDILIYDGNTLELITQLDYHTDTVYDVTFSEYGNFILSGSLDGTIRLFGIPEP
jgi:WD40 repeat protein